MLNALRGRKIFGERNCPGVLFAPAAPGNNSELTTIALKTEPVHLFLVFLQSYPLIW